MKNSEISGEFNLEKISILKMQSNSNKKCKVCECKENVCFHYGVCTCRACGAFFRYFLK